MYFLLHLLFQIMTISYHVALLMNVLANQTVATAELSDFFHFVYECSPFVKSGEEERPQLVTM